MTAGRWWLLSLAILTILIVYLLTHQVPDVTDKTNSPWGF